jgi:PAS domain S-box-containing protein/putative nucleotidyltransferase with HDIG domain
MASAPDALAVLCDADGRVLDVLCETITLTRRPKIGLPLSTIIAASDAEKLVLLFRELTDRGFAFDWNINLDTPLGVTPFRFAGTATATGFMIMATEGKNGVNEVLEQLVSMNSELVNSVRELEQRGANADVSLEEFTRLNNSLVNLQRELTRKNSELERGYEFLHTIISASPVPTVVNDGQQHITFLNPAFVQTFGYNQEDIPTLADWWPKAYPDPDYRQWVADTWEAGLERMQRTGAAVSPFEVTARCKDGTSRTVLASATSLSGSFSGSYLGVLYDITERRESEAELVRRETQLEELLAERERNLAQLAASLSSIIGVVSQVVETRDPYTAGHQRRVAELAVRISEEMGMSTQQVSEIRTAALIHDVGKMSVPAEILSRPGTLSRIEYELIKGHAEAGHDIVAAAHMPGPIAELVFQHHERCDGSGYPRGLDDHELLPGAKVLMVADVVEAMMSHRPYRAALGQSAALAEIEQGAGTLYDPEVCEACATVFRQRGFSFAEV